jgi:hypothetical protein
LSGGVMELCAGYCVMEWMSYAWRVLPRLMPDNERNVTKGGVMKWSSEV